MNKRTTLHETGNGFYLLTRDGTEFYVVFIVGERWSVGSYEFFGNVLADEFQEFDAETEQFVEETE